MDEFTAQENPAFKSVRQNSRSKQIADTIRTMILTEQLKTGERLPSERDLAKSMGVGRLSLREGLRILESEGIIETRYGVRSGTYVSEISVENLAGRFSNLLMLSNISLDQLTEARLEISLVNLKYFLEKATSENMEELEKCLTEAETLFRAGMRTREENLRFHRLIARGSGNPMFIFIHDSVMEVLRQFLSRFESPKDHSKRVIASNRRILSYIKKRDLEKAVAAYKEHILYTGKRLKMLINKSSDLRP